MPKAYNDTRISIEILSNLGPLGNNAYILRPSNNGPATSVDVPEGSEATITSLAGLPVERIIVTHSHADHWNGFETMRDYTAAPVFAGSEETNLEQSRDVQTLQHAEEFLVGDATVKVIHTPGHTPGSICLHTGGALLTGDTLFPGGPGHSRSPESLQQEIESITSKLYTLTDQTIVLPGHGNTTTIGQSKAEYEIFANREHDEELHGDVLWLET